MWGPIGLYQKKEYEDKGFHLLFYPNCYKLCEELNNSFFDVVLANIKIETNIAEFHDKLHEKMPGVGSIYILNDETNLDTVKQKGCLYITKPFEMEKVISLIDKILEK